MAKGKNKEVKVEAPDGDEPKIRLTPSVVTHILKSKFCVVGGINAYICNTCHKSIYVIHAASGVTPMFMRCKADPKCGGSSRSQMYQFTSESISVSIKWEWYRPNLYEYKDLSNAMRDHVDKGGLMIRERGKSSESS